MSLTIHHWLMVGSVHLCFSFHFTSLHFISFLFCDDFILFPVLHDHDEEQRSLCRSRLALYATLSVLASAFLSDPICC